MTTKRLSRLNVFSLVARPSVLAASILALITIAPAAWSKEKGGGSPVPGKTATPKSAAVQATVVSLEGNTLKIGPQKKEGSKEPQVLTLAPNCVITLTPDAKVKGAGAVAGKREDIVPGIGVRLSLDGTTVQAIEVMGRHVNGGIGALADGAITIRSKSKDGGPTEETFTLAPDTLVILSQGKEKGSAQTGTAADLKVGMQVSLQLSAVNKTTVRQINVQPVTPAKTKTGKL